MGSLTMAVCTREAENMIAAHTMKLDASTVPIWCWNLEDSSRTAAPELMLEPEELEYMSGGWQNQQRCSLAGVKVGRWPGLA